MAVRNHAETIFAEAIEIVSPEDRAAFLDRACQENPALRQDVEKLVVDHFRAGKFLEAPVIQISPPTADQPTSERAGTQIGPYKLIEQIGEGGMGTVWMAQQSEPVKRVVALKLIKAGMDSQQVIARFEAERQALALMDHPNIAKVLDGGTVGAAKFEGGRMKDEPDSSFRLHPSSLGRPYFVMDLVRGVPITRYCDEHHLTPRQRLELFIPVCQAIQHAHQKGIIHRDLKPSNVLVALYDGKPVPKVIDFGVAKAAGQSLTDKTLVTGFGNIVGTLEYMSPEQAEVNQLDIDTRSDIYSLGVLLYELLTGSPPFSRKELETAGMLEMLRVIREEEPSKPSTKLSSSDALPTLSANRGTEPAKLTKLVRGELDWIVMKALEKDRNRRYETANGFAMDVQRYLADEQVLACPPSAFYRLRKFARRNKGGLAVAAALAVAILVVVGTLGWGIRDREAHAQDAARERAARQAAIELEVNLALKEAERWQEQEKWPEALSAAKRAEGLLAGSGSDELRERVHQLRKDLEMVLRLEEIRLLSNEWKDKGWDFETADRAYAQAFRDYGIDVAGLPVEEAAARIRARTGVALALVAALDDWAAARHRTGKAGGLALTAVAQIADSDPWRRQVREAHEQKDAKALAALAASPQLLRQPQTSLLVLHEALRSREMFEARIEVMRQAQRQYPGDFWINLTLADCLRELGPANRDEAVSFHRAALAARPRSKAAYVNLGGVLREQAKVEEAIACFRKAIELDPKFARAHTNLGCALKDQGKLDEAAACHRKAIELDPKSAAAHNNLGALLCDDLKDYENAAECFRKAIELAPKKAELHANLGVALLAQKNLDEAIACFRKAIALTPKLPKTHDYLGRALAEKCWALANHSDPKLRDFRLAVAVAKEAIEVAPESPYVWQYVGWVQYRAGSWNASIEALEKSCKLQEGGTGDSCQWIVLALAHARLTAQKALPEKEQEHHRAEGRRHYEQADKQIDSMWRARPGDKFGQAVWDFRAEARELMGLEKKKD